VTFGLFNSKKDKATTASRIRLNNLMKKCPSCNSVLTMSEGGKLTCEKCKKIYADREIRFQGTRFVATHSGEPYHRVSGSSD
jgi:DNA-directed RNA polymerase subunit M/transcription elongation factor TFIIS